MLAPWDPMSRRQRSRSHLHAVPDRNASAAPKDRPRKRRSREPDPELFPVDDFVMTGDMPPFAEMGVRQEIAAMGRAADDLPIDDILDQLAALGMPRELVDQSRGLGDEHRAELAGLLTAATAMINGDPVAGLLGVWEPLLNRKVTAFDAEMAAAEILWTFDVATGDDNLVDGLTQLIDAAEQTGRPEALVMCRMLSHLGPPEVRSLATRAANTLAGGGIRDRPWVSSLGTATFHRAYGFTDAGGQVLAVEFRYGRRHHAFVFLIDETEGCVVGLYATDEVDELFRQIRLEALTHQLPGPSELSAAEAAEAIRSALGQPFCSGGRGRRGGDGGHRPDRAGAAAPPPRGNRTGPGRRSPDPSRGR